MTVPAEVAYPQGPECKKCGSTEKFPTGRCRPCGIARGRAWYATPEYKRYSRARDATPERQAQRKEHAASPERKEAYSLYFRRYKYGLSSEQQSELLASQNGMCASCGEPLKPGKDTHLDHNHVTNRARGFLCCKCNVAIGMMRDSPLLLRKAAAYLELHVGEPLREPELPRLRLSASQVQTFVNCKRAWAWKYVEGVEEPGSPAAEKGRAVHAELEKYLTGGAIDFTSEIGYIAASGLQHLPKPGTWVPVGDPPVQRWVPTPGLLVESEFHFVGPSGHSYLGFKDLELPGVIYDHKTTSDLKWQKTPDDLKTDIQATLYAVDYFRKHPHEPDVELRWVYYQTKNTKKSAVTKLRVNQTETWTRFLMIEEVAKEMAIASTKRALELPPSVDHCNDYGGCPHQGRCNLSPFDKMHAHVQQQKLRNDPTLRAPIMENKLLANLKTKKNGAPPVEANGGFAGMTPVAVAPTAPTPAAPTTPTAPPAASSTANKMLAKLRANGAPAATPVAPVASPVATTVAPVATTVAPVATTVAPGQINPPEFQPPPTAPVTPAAARTMPGVETAGVGTTTGEAAATDVATRGRGRPTKAVLPETGLAVKIKTLYINCGPVGVPVVDAAQLIVLAKKRIEAMGLADYRFAEYGQGPGMLSVAVLAELDAIEGVIPALRLDTHTPEGGIIAVELQARSGLVVR